MVSELDRAYIAGLFDGEGTIHFKRGMEKKKKHRNKPGYRYSNSLRLSMEIAMTDESVLIWIHQTLGVGTLNKKPRKGLRKDGTPYLMQYRWRATFRDAYLVCLYLWPFAHTKLPKIQQIIEHYAKQKNKSLNAEIISLEKYRIQKNV